MHITKTDLEFWTSDANITDETKGLITGAQKSLSAYKDRIQFIEDGKEPVPGITAVAAPGHTAGHVVFMLTSGGKTICNSADIAHHPIIIVEKPEIEFAFDLGKKQAVATRKRFFDMLATDRIPMLAYHFPWPGLGNIAREAGGFRYHPQPMDMMPISGKKG